MRKCPQNARKMNLMLSPYKCEHNVQEPKMLLAAVAVKGGCILGGCSTKFRFV